MKVSTILSKGDLIGNMGFALKEVLLGQDKYRSYPLECKRWERKGLRFEIVQFKSHERSSRTIQTSSRAAAEETAEALPTATVDVIFTSSTASDSDQTEKHCGRITKYFNDLENHVNGKKASCSRARLREDL